MNYESMNIGINVQYQVRNPTKPTKIAQSFVATIKNTPKWGARSVLEFNNKILWLQYEIGHSGEGIGLNPITEEGTEEIRYCIERFVKKVETNYNAGTLGQLKNNLEIDQSFIEYKDPDTGFNFLVTTSGLAHLLTPRGLRVQITPYSLTLRDLNGRTTEMELTHLESTLQNITKALGKEATDWILNYT